MFIKGKNNFNAEMIYQRKAYAVSITQSFIIKFSKNSLCAFFNVFSNAKDGDIAFIHLTHKLNRSCVTASGFKKGIGFIQNIIRSTDSCFIIMNLLVNGFCCCIMLVFWNGESAESACINEDF